MIEEDLIKQLNSVIDECENALRGSRYSDYSELPAPQRQGLLTKCIAVVHRVTSSSSQYVSEVNRILRDESLKYYALNYIFGIVKALRDDVQAGYVQSVSELIHGEIFADFLEMAHYLIENGYKDPAAVIAGSTLESHIRKLCEKNGLSVEETNKDGDLKPLKADRLNSDLYKASVYSLLDQKSVTVWLDLRNKAAHGEYDKYNADQVKMLIQGVLEFISRNPA